MKRLLFIYIVSIFLVFFALDFVLAYQDYNVEVAGELTSDLKIKGISEADIKGMEGSLKNMLKLGVTKEDINMIISDLSNSGMQGKYIRSSLELVNDLIVRGENPKGAINIVSKVLSDAKAKGLKGKGFSKKVIGLLKQRRQERIVFAEIRKKQITKELENAERKLNKKHSSKKTKL